MFLIHFARCILDPMLLNLFVRVVAREEAEQGYWRAFLVNLVLLAVGVGLTIIVDTYQPEHGIWIQIGVISLIGFGMIVKMFKVSPLRAVPVLVLFVAYLFAASFSFTYLWNGNTDLPQVVRTQYPSANDLRNSFDLNYLMNGTAEADEGR